MRSAKSGNGTPRATKRRAVGARRVSSKFNIWAICTFCLTDAMRIEYVQITHFEKDEKMKLITVMLLGLGLMGCQQVEPGEDDIVVIPDRDIPTEKY